MLSKGNHKETLPMRQGLTLHILLPLQMSFFTYILFFIAGWLLLLLLSSNFHSTLPGMVLQEPLFACVWFFFVVVVADRSVLWWQPRDSYCSRHSGSGGHLAGWFENIVSEPLCSAMCLVCNPLTSQSPTTARARSHSEWMVSHCILRTMTVHPLQPQRSAGVKWLIKWLTTATDVAGMPKK